MGNNSLNVCKIQALGIEVAGQFCLPEAKDIIYSEVLFPKKSLSSVRDALSILIANPSSVQLYSLSTGQKLAESVQPVHPFVSCMHLPASKHGNIIIASDSLGTMHILDTFSLRSLANIAPLAEGARCGININQEEVLTAYHNGSIKAWDVASFTVNNVWSDERTPKSIAFSHTHCLIAVGFEYQYDGIKVNPNPIKLFHLQNKENASRELEEFEGSCESLVVIDQEKFVIALNNYNIVYVWDILTTALLFTFKVPVIKKAVCLEGWLLQNNDTLIVIGGTDGDILISRLNLCDTQLHWFPLKVINVFSQSKISWISYSSQMDSLIVGNSKSYVHIVPNIVNKVHKEEFNVHSFEKENPAQNTDSDDSDSDLIEDRLQRLKKSYPDKSDAEIWQMLKEEEAKNSFNYP